MAKNSSKKAPAKEAKKPAKTAAKAPAKETGKTAKAYDADKFVADVQRLCKVSLDEGQKKQIAGMIHGGGTVEVAEVCMVAGVEHLPHRKVLADLLERFDHIAVKA